MKLAMSYLLVLAVTVLFTLQPDASLATIGFGQSFDSALEGENKILRVLLEPGPLDNPILGRIVPLTIEQYRNYDFTAPRTVPEIVEETISASNVDPAEHEVNRMDFENANISVLINGTTSFNYDISNIIKTDDVNEAEELFILVLEIDNEGIEFDEEGGILVYTILDNNPIILNFNVSSSSLQFNENVGVINNVVSVEKQNKTLQTEVDIAFQIIIGDLTAVNGIDFITLNSIYPILMNEFERSLDPIHIIDDLIPETSEIFTLSLGNGPGADTLNVFPTEQVVYITILDNDVAQISFTEELYTVTEGRHVEVCIEVTDGESHVSLDSSFGSENFSISTISDSAESGSDYNAIADPTILTLERGQDVACSTIEIFNDTLVETDEVFNVTLTAIHSTFYAGVDIIGRTATIEIRDNNFAVIGFNETTKTITEESGGVTTSICVEVIHPSDASINYSLIVPSNLPDVVFGLTMGSLPADNLIYCHDITLIDNNVVEPNRVFEVKISQSSLWPSSTIIRNGTLTMTIINDDELVIYMEAESERLYEGSAVEITVRFEGELAQGVIINGMIEALTMDNSDDADFILQNGSFTLADGNSVKNITLTAVDDNLLENREENFTLSLTISNQSVKYRISGASSLNIMIEDNEDLVFRFEETVYEVPELDHIQSIWVEYNDIDVQLPNDPSSMFVTLNVLIESSSNATEGDDFTVQLHLLIFNSTTANGRMDIRFVILDDELFEGQEVIRLRLTDPAIIGLMNTASVAEDGRRTVVIINDDDEYAVGFNRTNTSGVEGHSIEVCIETTAGILAPNITVPFLVRAPREDPLLPEGSPSDTAIASTEGGTDGDYRRTQERVSLSAAVTSACITIDLVADSFVEIDEMFLVQVAQVRSSDDLLVGLDPEYTIVTIIGGRCPVEVNGGIQWPWTLEGTTAFRPCSEAGSMFRVGPRASRQCDQEGEWEDADLTSCTIADIEEPFILVWFVIDAEEYTDSMEQDFIDNLASLLDLIGILYSRVSLKSAYIASVAITFQVDLVEGDQTQNISSFSSFVEDSESFSSFSGYSVMEGGRGSLDVRVADTCLCSSAGMGSSLQLCSGAAISPCDCMDAVCMCQTPFVGDGMSCTLDSDSDGYPDQPLDSPSCSSDEAPSYCTADVCPDVTNPEQDPMACQPDATIMEVFVGCPYGDDDEWAITWPNTPGGSISTQPCPGGVDTNGTATRVCYENETWGAPDVLSCQSLEILRISEMANDLLPAADDEIDEVTPELIENAEMVSEQLAIATDTQQEAGLLPLDLNSTNSIVAQVLNVLESSVEEGIGDTPNDELIDVFNNVLNETNEGGWTALQTIGSGSQTLLQNAERYGTYLTSAVNNTGEPLMLVRENIIVSAEVVDTSSNVSDFVFPESPSQLDNFTSVDVNDTVQITIPGSALTTLTEGKGVSDVSIVHIIFRNLEDFLPANASYLSNSRAESLVISSQLGGLDPTDIPENIFQENPIILNFSFTTSPDSLRVIEYLGVFWEFSDPVGSGGWSSEGVQVISNETRGDLTIVQCSSTHLTSFAVLVDVSGGLEDVPKVEKLALQVVSYIGCIISCICLSITVVFYLAMGKKLFSAVHYFVHLNLALTLLLGYVVFMLGIELGTTSIGGCAFVAALLQYLFLSAFCWMMCEGIMLYLMLIVVFSRLSKKWWSFMILGYCTPLLFVVIGLAARVYYYGVKDDYGELSFCWLSTEKGTIFAFVAPVLAIVIINTVFLVMALVVLGRNKKEKAKALDKDKSAKQAMTLLKAAVILLPLLGLTWLFGLLTLNNNSTVFAWLFTIFNSLQGAAIFFFHVIRSNRVWSKISPRLRQIKQYYTFKSSLKYDVPNPYSGPESQIAMRALLHKKPLDSSALSYDSSGQPMSSIGSESFSESATDDFEKKPLDTIPEGDVIVTTPSTEGKTDEQQSKEEITRL